MPFPVYTDDEGDEASSRDKTEKSSDGTELSSDSIPDGDDETAEDVDPRC